MRRIGPALSRRAVLAGVLAAPALSRARAQSEKGLTLTWGEDDNAARTYDPRVTSSRHETQVIVQVFDTLVASDGSNKLWPGLATSWDIAPDGKSVTLKLREDVQFHDGTLFDADAVKFSFDSIVDPKLASEAAITQLGPYAGADVISPSQIRINYSQPFGAALASYAEGTLAPVSPTAVRKLGNQGFARAPVGTGPFRFVSWQDGQQVLMERFDAYNWGPPYFTHRGPSKVARLVHRYIPDASTRVAALEAGEIDMSDATPVLDMKRFADDRRYGTLEGNASGVPFGLELNGSRGIFQDVSVRRALAMAIDRTDLADNLFFGMIGPAFGPLSTSTPGYWPGAEKMYQPDPKAAIALLEEAGWKPGPGGIRAKDGQPLSAFYGAPPPLEPDTAVEVQARLKRVGFDIRVETITFARNQDLVFNNTYDMLPVRWAQADPMCLENLFSSLNITTPGHYKYNWMHLSDPKLDALFAQGRAETDQAKRTEIYGEAQKIIMDTALWFPVHNQVETVAYHVNRKGYRFARTDWNVLFYDVDAA
ncbi:MAG TPA: ABC transporter substrate-binding protein [Acetobacteraceae bacterium]|nr:ABC transporter substrate-binding protein [Acetobacteraceae bacterium]